MIKGVTASGFHYELKEGIEKDWRLVQCLTKLKELEDSDSEEIEFINSMATIEKLIFTDKGKALEKYLASKNNDVIPTDEMLKELLDILKNDSTKN